MKVLVVGIHIDDCECMAGTASLLVKAGAEVTYLNIKRYMHHKGGNPKVDEMSLRGAEIIGAKKIILDYESPNMVYKTNDKTVLAVKDIICEMKPDIIFMMHPKDNNMGHVECSKTTYEAIYMAAVERVIPNEIYSYELGPKQNMCYLKPDVYVDIETTIEDTKKSFLNFQTNHADGERLWRDARASKEFRGIESGLRYADGFQIIKYPKGSNDFLLRSVLGDKFRWGDSGQYMKGAELFF